MSRDTLPTRPRDEALIAHLEALAARAERDDSRARAALAALRRGLGRPPGAVAEVEPHVAPFLPEQPSWRDAPYYLVATLFALHPNASWRRAEGERGFSNLGASFAWLARQTESGSTEKRFVALLNAPAEDLPEHLRHAVSLMKAHDIPVDWRQLLRDLDRWDREDRRAQREWARAYWGVPSADAPAASGADADTTVTSATE